jgi:hypothetical protein
MAIEPTDN